MNKFQKIYLIFIGFIALFLLIVHTFSLLSSLLSVVVDTYSLLLIVILIFLPLIPNFKKIKWGEFEAEITSEEITKIDKSLSKIKPSTKSEVKGYTREEVGDLANYLFSLVEIDPVLALAKLRIEMENVIRTIYKSVIKKRAKRIESFSVSLMISELEQESTIDKELLHNAKEVMMICNKTIHGGNIKLEDATHVVTLGMTIMSYLYGYYSGHSTKLKEFV